MTNCNHTSERSGTKRHHHCPHLRTTVIYQRFTLGKGVTSIAKDLDMSVRTIERILKIWRDLGVVIKKPSEIGRAPILHPLQQQFLLSLLEHSPQLYLDELAEELAVQHGIHVSLSSIWRTIQRLGIRRKKLSKVADERCEEARTVFQLAIGAESPERLVFTDESSIDLRTTYQLMGWAYKGERARMRAKFVRGDRYSVLPALSQDGIIFSDICIGSYNGDSFLEYIDGLLEQMNPYPGPRSVLVLDNCRIHHVPGVRERCEEQGIKIMYLPAYSPDLNPIEEAFSFVKGYIRRHGERFQEAVASKERDLPFIFLHEALDQITPEMVRGWMGHAGYI